ncbi:ATP-binding protein [Novipirellula rosea]|uniref:Double zinc ribbon n=1 Tax=Novipirellula rosea TaxID=1031540 RepID=A0ABP8N5H6_9BACT
MEFVHVQCHAGHRLKAGTHLRGRTLPCPKCRAEVVVPQPKDTLSDTGVMRILGDLAPLSEPPVAKQQPPQRPCPRCSLEVSVDLSVCNHCQCFIGIVPDYMKQIG